MLDLRLYPPLLLWHACALGAFMNHRFSTLRFLRDSLDYLFARERRDLWTELRYWIAEQTPLWNDVVLSGARSFTPINDHLCDLLHRALAHLSPLRATFDLQYDSFEYFLGLISAAPHSNSENLDAPIGSFLWRRAGAGNFGQGFVRQAENRGHSWPPFQAGLFEKSQANLARTVEVFDEYIDNERAASSRPNGSAVMPFTYTPIASAM